GEREVSEGACTGLVETMGTIVGNWLVNSSRQPAPQPAPPPDDQKPPDPKPPDPKPPDPKPTPPTRPRFAAELGPVVSFRALPATAAFGIAGGVGARWRMFSITLGLHGVMPSSARTATKPPREVRASLIAGTLAPCVHLSWFLGCGLVTGGAMIAD